MGCPVNTWIARFTHALGDVATWPDRDDRRFVQRAVADLVHDHLVALSLKAVDRVLDIDGGRRRISAGAARPSVAATKVDVGYRGHLRMNPLQFRSGSTCPSRNWQGAPS